MFCKHIRVHSSSVQLMILDYDKVSRLHVCAAHQESLRNPMSGYSAQRTPQPITHVLHPVLQTNITVTPDHWTFISPSAREFVFRMCTLKDSFAV